MSADIDSPPRRRFRRRILPFGVVLASLLTHGRAQEINTLSDLDAYIAGKFDFLSNTAAIYPPGPFLFPINCGVVPFAAAGELAALTNRLPTTPVLRVPMYRVTVYETQDVSRLWLYCGADGAPFRTNTAPVAFDAEAWVQAAYRHAPPGYLSGTNLARWFADRDRCRLRLTLSLVSDADLPALQAAQQASMTNPPSSGPAHPVPPPDTNRLAFAGLQFADNILGLWLYTPAPRPVSLFTRTNLAGPAAGWSYAGNLDAQPPFNLWQCAMDRSTAFFRAGFSDVDSDGDGIPDILETLVWGTDPTFFDSVGGTLGDYVRVLIYGLGPLAVSTVGDGIPDWWKIAHGINPLDPGAANQDPDGDGLCNLTEYFLGTDPQTPSSYSSANPGSPLITTPLDR